MQELFTGLHIKIHFFQYTIRVSETIELCFKLFTGKEIHTHLFEHIIAYQINSLTVSSMYTPRNIKSLATIIVTIKSTEKTSRHFIQIM